MCWARRHPLASFEIDYDKWNAVICCDALFTSQRLSSFEPSLGGLHSCIFICFAPEYYVLYCEFNRTLQRLPDKSHVMVVGAVLECNVQYLNVPSDLFWNWLIFLSSGSQGASSNRRRLWAVDQTRKSQIVQLQLRGNIRDDSGWATFALFGNKKLTSACSLTLALWRCVKAIWIFFRVQQAKFICQILFQASFVNFGDSFNLNIYHETTTVSNSQQFKHLFVHQEQQQHGGRESSQKQLSMDTFLPSKFQHQSNPLESPRTQNGAFSSMSLRQ